MPANHKVSVGWQIVFTFISILNLWAFYRIRKLRKYAVYVIMPSVFAYVTIYAYILVNAGPLAQSDFVNPLTTPLGSNVLSNIFVASYASSIGFQALTIYLVIIWSRQHNRQFDQPAVQPADGPR